MTEQQQLPEPTNGAPKRGWLGAFSPLGVFGNNNQAHASNGEFQSLMYGMWSKTVDWQDNLHRKAAHKALNIPEDGVINSSTTTIHKGMGAIPALVLALAALLGGAGLMYGLMGRDVADKTTTETVETVVKETIEKDIIFFDGEGNQVIVPNISKAPPEVQAKAGQ